MEQPWNATALRFLGSLLTTQHNDYRSKNADDELEKILRFDEKHNGQKGQPTKILCHYALETIFLNLYYDIKLHGDLEKWFSKLNFQNLDQLSQQKRELLAFMCIKKAYFHKRMLRFRKCEEALKISRKFSSSLAVGLISCYSLAKLYLEHK